MANMGRLSIVEMKRFQKQLNKIQQDNIEAFLKACAKELSARLLSNVIECTPVGQYPTNLGKKDGTLHRGWTSKTHEEAASGGKASAKAYADSLTIHHYGNTLIIEIVNPVEYALT